MTVAAAALEDHDDLTCNTKLCSELERQGVADLLEGLSQEEIAAMPDANTPLRHFRAEKGNTAKALKQLKETLQWRKDFQVDTLRSCFVTKDEEVTNNNNDDDNEEPDEKKDDHDTTTCTGQATPTTAAEFRTIMAEENSTGKIYVRGFDKDGRAVVYMRPGWENTNNEANNMRHLVWNMEKAIAVTQKQGFQKMSFIIDYKDFKLLHAPPLSTSKHTLDIMQNHYPERCHRFYFTNPPFAFTAVWALVKPFVDPHTKEKMVFCSGTKGIDKLIDEMGGDAAKLESCAGGTDVDNLKPFDSLEYLNLPLHQTFDDEAWARSGAMSTTTNPN